MTTMPRTFRKKPVEIQAIQFIEGVTTVAELRDFAPGINIGVWMRQDENGDLVEGNDPSDIRWVEIPTLEGGMIASYGDWIIRGVEGEFYPCKPRIFEATYEEVQ